MQNYKRMFNSYTKSIFKNTTLMTILININQMLRVFWNGHFTQKERNIKYDLKPVLSSFLNKTDSIDKHFCIIINSLTVLWKFEKGNKKKKKKTNRFINN